MILELFFAITSLVGGASLSFLFIVAKSRKEIFQANVLVAELGEMGFRIVPYYTIFLLQLFLCSGSSIAEIPPLEGIKKGELSSKPENRMLLSSPMSISQLDTVPVVIPTIPGNNVNPTTSPPAPTVITPTPPARMTAPATGTAVSGAWCIASTTASQTALQVALDYACGYGGADCSVIQPGSSCYDPNTVRDHASYAFNDYYQKNPTPTSCVFGGTAQLTYTDPSNGNCHYASPSTSSTPPPPSPPLTTTPATTTPATTIPVTTTPSPPGGYGIAEPTSLPSSATSTSSSLLLLFTASGSLWSLSALGLSLPLSSMRR